jgi:hypothetical protein
MKFNEFALYLHESVTDQAAKLLNGAPSYLNDLMTKVQTEDEHLSRMKENEIRINLFDKLFPLENKIQFMIAENPEIILNDVPEELLLFSEYKRPI